MTQWKKIECHLPPEIVDLAAKRWEARVRGDFAESDRIRERLATRGYVMRDRRDGYEIEHIS